MLTRTQRILWISTCLVGAVTLHLTMCEWGWKALYLPERQIVAWQTPTSIATLSTGLFSGQGIERSQAIVFGVVTPMALLAAAGSLFLGWHAAARRSRGACPQCGYTLGADRVRGCPECGWGREP